MKEGLDASASLFTLEGETLAQAVATRSDCHADSVCGQYSCGVPADDTIREGDITDERPYLGGTHLPDFAVIMPVFHNGRPIAFSATMTHHQDVGGIRRARFRRMLPRCFRRAFASHR